MYMDTAPSCKIIFPWHLLLDHYNYGGRRLQILYTSKRSSLGIVYILIALVFIVVYTLKYCLKQNTSRGT